jgi:putative transposase
MAEHGQACARPVIGFFHVKFASVEELCAGLSEYIRYYNHDRIKMKLKGLSPVQFRTQPLAA